MTKKKDVKPDIKATVSVNSKGELEVDSNVAPLLTASLFADAISLITRDLAKDQKAKEVQPIIESDGIN